VELVADYFEGCLERHEDFDLLKCFFVKAVYISNFSSVKASWILHTKIFA